MGSRAGSSAPEALVCLTMRASHPALFPCVVGRVGLRPFLPEALPSGGPPTPRATEGGPIKQKRRRCRPYQARGDRGRPRPSGARAGASRAQREGAGNARGPGGTPLERSTWRLPSATRRHASICARVGGSAPGPHVLAQRNNVRQVALHGGPRRCLTLAKPPVAAQRRIGDKRATPCAPEMGARRRPQRWVPDIGPRHRPQTSAPDIGPRHRTQTSDPDRGRNEPKMLPHGWPPTGGQKRKPKATPASFMLAYAGKYGRRCPSIRRLGCRRQATDWSSRALAPAR
jgi:hypothetical protein